MPSPVINPVALEPLFGPADVPNRHRVKAKAAGAAAEIKLGRRPSSLPIVQNLRRELSDWRDNEYPGASDTSRELLFHWFRSRHYRGEAQAPFQYYFCQRESIEALIYLYEVRGVRSLAGLIGEFEGADRERAALGVNPDEDRWARYAFKVATGAGKTKIMSLAIAWSYFHALRESDSTLAKHFVLIAPGLTVFERLKSDFGNGDIFEKDPVIPPAWKGDFNFSVVLQAEAGGSTSGGVLYLTNIHQLYDATKRGSSKTEMRDWAGPAVDRNKALDVGKALRERITAHPRLMVLNDEAHHVWDPDSTWNECIDYLHDATSQRGGGIVAQLDLSATPKDNQSNPFRHIVCETPLGEAIEAGIIKTPVIGHSDHLQMRAHDDAGYKYEPHLILGYKRWQASREEWEKSGKKPLMFVMTDSTQAAEEVWKRLNGDPLFADLNGKSINLHTNLKGKLKKRGREPNAYFEFVPSEKDISDDDLKALRQLSRELDEDSSPYRCIVSVLMLREGWDVKNVTTIVPLRALKSDILAEQTLGRGLRRMTPPGSGAAEVVTVVEHAAFLDLYDKQLSAEGAMFNATDVGEVPRTTVTIYPDAANKDLAALELLVPQLSQSYRIVPELGDVSMADVRAAAAHLPKLLLGKPPTGEMKYEGKHLITQELIEQMSIKLSLLQDGMGAISFFREMLEHKCKIRGTHAKLAPLIQEYLEEEMFAERVTLYDPRLLGRLGDADVREYVAAAFVPVIQNRVVQRRQRLEEAPPRRVSLWKPFQATMSERHPVATAGRTLFNLVPCNRQLEVAFAQFCDLATDVAAFAKNAGPQALRIDYQARGGHRAVYAPDFIVRAVDGRYWLVETKGEEDRDVPTKARAAVEWCKAASGQQAKWQYLYVPQDVFERATRNSVEELARACAPALAELLNEVQSAQPSLPFENPDDVRRNEQVSLFIRADDLERLPPRARQAIEHAVTLYFFHEKKPDVNFGPVFQPLLGRIDEACEGILVARLTDAVPAPADEQKAFFEPDMVVVKPKNVSYLQERARTLKKLLVDRTPLMPTGLLAAWLEIAGGDGELPEGIFKAARECLRDLAATPLPKLIRSVYNFRNEYIAHEKKELTDSATARAALADWVKVLSGLHAAAR